MAISNEQVLSQVGMSLRSTAVETAAGVTPTNFGYAPGDVRRYGAIGDGTTDDTAALQRAVSVLNAGQPVIYLTGWHVLNGTLTVTRSSSAIVGFASMQNTCGLLQMGNVDTLIFQAPTPANGISNCAIRDFAIAGQSTTPTGGRGLSVIFGRGFQASNIQVISCYKGLNIQGGYSQNWVNTIIQGPAGWTTRQAGTYALGVDIGPGNSIPAEITFSNFDWKGVTNAGVNTLDIAIQITCGDGLFFSNGHTGFANSASLSITSTASPAYIDSIDFDNVYLDGGIHTSASDAGIQIFGSVGIAITNVKFSGCEIANHATHGANISATANCARIRFTDTIIYNNGLYGVIFGAQTDVSVESCTFFNNNTANSGGVSAIICTGTQRYRFQNNLIYGNNYFSTGFNLANGIAADATSTGGSVTDNQFANCTNPMSIASPLTTFRGNRLLTGQPTVASSAALPATMLGFDSIAVTGVTGITSISGPNIDGQEMLLRFTGALTVTRGSNILLTTAGGNMVTTAGSTLHLLNDGTGWREVARAVA